MRTIGNKNTVLLGLGFQLLQLTWYGFGSEPWWALDHPPSGSVVLFWFCWVLTALGLFRMMWAAGTIAAMSSITFPAVSALVSHCASADQQGEYELTAEPLLGLLSFLINCVQVSPRAWSQVSEGCATVWVLLCMASSSSCSMWSWTMYSQ